MSRLNQCTCSRWEGRCNNRITQEDLLCDDCRKPCQGAMGYGPVGTVNQMTSHHLGDMPQIEWTSR
jgi:hypothetical protein